MDALYQIVGCVLSSKPAAERIDEFVAQVRRERAVVVHKDEKTATFVRLSAPDAKLVALACRAALGPVAPALRFGFACGVKEPSAASPDVPSSSHRGIAQAGDLAAGAREGEVLVSPDLALLLIEAGYSLRSKKVHLPGGRVIPACVLDLTTGAADGAPVGGRPSAESKAGAALGGVFRTLMTQAQELAHKHAELELRMDARLARMEGRLRVVEELDARIARLQHAASDLEQAIQSAKAELVAVREIGERTRADLDFIAAHRGDLADLRSTLEQLLGRAGEVDSRFELIASQREAVENVQARADAVAHMLGDMHVKLEMLGEQRAEIEHVGEQLARLDFSVAEAQNTLRALQREREVAERIEQGIRALRNRSAAGRPV